MSSLQQENLEPVKNLAEAIQGLQAIAQADNIVRHDKEVALLTASALNHIGDRLKVIDDRLRKVEDRQRDHESEPGRIAVSDTPQAGAQTQKF